MKTQKGLVVQSNKLIEARYRLTLQEKRLILWLISQINRDDIDFKKYEISVKDFAKMMELNPRTQYTEMRGITKSLLGRVIEIKEEHVDKIKQIAWLCFAEWDSAGGICAVEFHPELKPYLLQLKEQFTKIGFADLLGFKSPYSVRIFELLSQYATIGKRTTAIAEIRKWCGIQEDEYQKYNHLKSRVINKAKTEINAKTDYEVEFKEKKRSRKVDALDWTIQKKEHLKSNSNSPEAVSTEEVIRAIEELKEPPAIKVKRYEILSKIGAQEYFSWFHEAIFEEIEDGNVKMTPANDYAKQVWEDKYEKLVIWK